MKVELSREEVGKALVEFAARKAGVTGAVKHGISINGSWLVFDEGAPLVVVTLDRLVMASNPGGVQ